MAMTYASLVSQIQDYLQRTDSDTINAIPTFISTVENNINRKCKSIGFEQYVVGNFINANPVLQKPARWRRTVTFNYGTGTNFNDRNPIALRSYEFIRNYWPNPTLTSPPLFYADYGFHNWLIGPTPDQAYPFEVAYIEMPTPLSNQNQTNWLTNYAPDVLFYGSMVEAMRFLKNTNDNRLPEWKEGYREGIYFLMDEDEKRIFDRQSDRSSD